MLPLTQVIRVRGNYSQLSRHFLRNGDIERRLVIPKDGGCAELLGTFDDLIERDTLELPILEGQGLEVLSRLEGSRFGHTPLPFGLQALLHAVDLAVAAATIHHRSPQEVECYRLSLVHANIGGATGRGLSPFLCHRPCLDLQVPVAPPNRPTKRPIRRRVHRSRRFRCPHHRRGRR